MTVANPCIRIHPENPHLFLFRGQPLVLVTATEHYGAVMNRPFHFESYLAEAAEKRMTLTRLFMLFRELQTPMNPYSTCKPESPDYISPFQRTGPGRALDGELKYDLDRPNPEFFERLHRFVSLASSYGIAVEVVLLSNTYAPEIWALNPLNARNNLNGIEEIEWPHYLSQRNPGLWQRQVAHVRRIVTELNRYENVLYEICNEPGGRAPGKPEPPSMEEVNAWLAALMQVARETEASLPNRHLILGQEAFSYEPWEQPADRSFGELPYDGVNIHPLPNTTYGGEHFDMGRFMSKELKIRAVRDFCLAAYREPKPLNLDEDNVASQYKDEHGWTIHRKRAWVTLLSGAHYDYIDFSITPYRETGTADSRRAIRSWMKHLSNFVHALDLARGKPLRGLLIRQPEHTLEAVYGVPGQEYAIYLADERELDEPGYGQPIAGEVLLDLPPGLFQAALFEPKTGLYSPAILLEGKKPARLKLPAFVQDITIEIKRATP